MKYILESFEKKNNSKLDFFTKIWKGFTSKQRIGIIFLVCCLILTPVVAQTSSYLNPPAADQTGSTLVDIVQEEQGDNYFAVALLNDNYFIAGMIRSILNYIADSQISSIDTVATVPMVTDGIFDNILSGLTIFACIGCVYKLITAYIQTEAFDNVLSILKFFSYVPILVLFIFSQPIVDRLISLNEPINGGALREITVKIDNEVVREVKKDVKELEKQLKELNDEYDATNAIDVGNIIANRAEYFSLQLQHSFNANIKFGYFGIFSVILVSVMAIPTFIMAFMVKVLLTLMVAGTKLVFLLAFIPGFDDLWKGF